MMEKLTDISTHSFPSQRNSPENRSNAYDYTISTEIPSALPELIDGVAYTIELCDSKRWASIAYSNLVEAIKKSLERAGFDSSAYFDTTIVYELIRYHDLLGVEGIRLTDAPYDATDNAGRAPWFSMLERQQDRYDETRNAAIPWDIGTRPNVQLLTVPPPRGMPRKKPWNGKLQGAIMPFCLDAPQQ